MPDEKPSRCPACSGRGYHLCDCWPGDCICGFGDTECEECDGQGMATSDDDDERFWEEYHDPIHGAEGGFE